MLQISIVINSTTWRRLQSAELEPHSPLRTLKSTLHSLLICSFTLASPLELSMLSGSLDLLKASR